MGEIKPYQEVCVITRKDGNTIQTTATLDQLEKLINEWPQMLRFWDQLINKYDIISVEKQKLSELDAFIASVTDDEIKKRFKAIQKERKDKNLSINWVKHLIQIYTDRFGEISNAEDEKWYVYKAKDVYF